MIERGYFGRALQIVARDPLNYLVGGAVLLGLAILSFGILIGPAICGIVQVTLKHCRNENPRFADLFGGFDHFSNAVLAGIFFTFLVAAGLVLGLVPGVILGALFCFVFPFVTDRGMPLPEAMVASRTLPGPEDLLDRALFFIAILILGLSGIAIFLVGFVFTWSLMWAVVAVAWEDLAPAAAPAGTGEEA